jgi:hypothetical protein
MTDTPQDSATVQRLFSQVARRQRIAAWAVQCYLMIGIFATIYLALFLAGRLLGLMPDWYSPRTLLAVPIGAALVAFLFHHRPSPENTARLVDQQADTHDLFLTMTALDTAAGEFQPLVRSQATTAAAKVVPTQVVPYNWLPKTRNAAIIGVILTVACLQVPQLDPFGNQAQRDRVQAREKRLEESKKATEIRLARLKEKPKDKLSPEVQGAVKYLTAAFTKMKPDTPKENAKSLRSEQTKLNELWRENNKKLKNAMDKSPVAQSFGGGDQEKKKEWREGIRKGDLSSIKKEIDAIQKMAAELIKTQNPAAADGKQKELEQRIGELADFVKKELKSKSLDAVLERAAEQIEMANMKGMQKKARAAAGSSMELSKEELAGLQKTMNDLAALQKAMEAAQAANQLNSKGQMDGSKVDPQAAMAECAALFQEWLAQQDNEQGHGHGQGQGNGQGQRNGGGMSSPGQGAGGIAPTDPWQNTEFKTEKTQTLLQAGETLMEWETKEIADAGEVKQEYLQTVRKVQQGVSETILQEQIPPGYHEAIKEYFDTIDDDVPAPASPAEAPK